MVIREHIKKLPLNHGRGRYLYPKACDECGTEISDGDFFYSKNYRTRGGFKYRGRITVKRKPDHFCKKCYEAKIVVCS